MAKQGFFDGVNMQRLLMAAGALFVAIAASDYLIHNVLLKQLYAESMSLWRPQTDMQSKMPFLMLGELCAALSLAVIFSKGYQKRGILEGVRFGLLTWLFAMSSNLMQYMVYPLSMNLLVAWTFTGLAQFVLGGVVLSLVYKK